MTPYRLELEPPVLHFRFPCKTVSPNADRTVSLGGRMEQAHRTKVHKHQAWAETLAALRRWGKGVRVPALVVLTRIDPEPFDSDNAIGSMKAARDGVARALGVDDGSPLLTWRYAQRSEGEAVSAVEVEIMQSPSDEETNPPGVTLETHEKKTTGFASMDPERQREIASQGGKTAHARGVGHRFDSESGRRAGSQGGRTVSSDPDHMREIGRKGGRAARAKRQAP